MDGDKLEGSVDCVSKVELVQALSEMKTGEKKTMAFRCVIGVDCCYLGVEIYVMAEICQRVLDGFVMSVELAPGIVVLIFKGKSDIRKCSCYEALKQWIRWLWQALSVGMLIYRAERMITS